MPEAPKPGDTQTQSQQQLARLAFFPLTRTIPPMPNPLREGLHDERLPEPCTMVIFGASGDLTRRKLMPAIYSLARDRLLPPNLAVIGVARRAVSDDDFRKDIRSGIDEFARRRPVDPALWDSFASGLTYLQGAFDDQATYGKLKERLAVVDRERGIPGNHLFYLATPPDQFPIILRRLGAAGLIRRGQAGTRPFTRIIIEKPFGVDLKTAQDLNHECMEVASERQIYRIDHYLGKETVQNLVVFRFANGIFEPLWNNKYIDNVQITGAESIGIEGRGGYFDHAGILRDMVQNHLFQILSLSTMEPPVAWSADELRDEKVKLLKSLRPIPDGQFGEYVVRGQYGPGSVGGKRVIGYREENGVPPDSRTETYVALKFFIDNWRWAGVPFYLRAGKAMPKKVTEVALTFKAVQHRLFRTEEGDATLPNVLAIRIQPDEGISLRFGSKVPGPTLEIHPVTMEFRYGSSFGVEPPEAYERLLLDCMLGEATLFTRGDEVEASWRWIERIHQAWAKDPSGPAPYPAGTWGPKQADELLERDGRKWRHP
jgi:glucose-6-phosphate 1-dehydrogenase